MKKLINTSYVILIMALLACNPKNDKNKNEAKPDDTTSTEIKKETADLSAIQKNDEQYVGRWVIPNPINEKEVEGFELLKDGSAKSINRATLDCKKWWSKSDTLYMIETSIGNNTSFTDTVAYKVERIGKDGLSLKNGEQIIDYKRQ